MHYNPNTDDIVEWVQHYASAAITADRAVRAQADSVTAPAAGAVAGPVLWVSPGQLEVFKDTDDAPFGTYIPARKTSAGKFTMPLFAAAPTPPAQAADSVLEDAARYRAFIGCGQPICFIGEEYYGKAALDAAIDAAMNKGGAA